MRTQPGLAKATEVFRGLPPREKASILRAQAENPRLPPERRADTLRTARNLERQADWQERQNQPTPGQDAAARRG